MNIIRCQACDEDLLYFEKHEKTTRCLCGVKIFCGECFKKIIKSEIIHHEQQQRFGIKYGIFR